MPPKPENYAITLARYFIARAQAAGLRGRKRDEAALEYFLGAAQLAAALGDWNTHHHLGTVAALIISPQGYAGIEAIARGAPPPDPGPLRTRPGTLLHKAVQALLRHNGGWIDDTTLAKTLYGDREAVGKVRNVLLGVRRHARQDAWHRLEQEGRCYRLVLTSDADPSR